MQQRIYCRKGRQEADGRWRWRRSRAGTPPPRPAATSWPAANLNPRASHLAHRPRRPASAGHGPQGHTGRAYCRLRCRTPWVYPQRISSVSSDLWQAHGSNQDGWVAHQGGLKRGGSFAVRFCATEEHADADDEICGARQPRCLNSRHWAPTQVVSASAETSLQGLARPLWCKLRADSRQQTSE